MKIRTLVTYFWQLDQAVFIATAGTTQGMQDVFHSLKKSSVTYFYLVPFLPYQRPSLATWKTALEDSGHRVRQISEPVIGQRQALDVMIGRLKMAAEKLGLEER